MIVLDGSGLSIEKLVRIARFGEPVSLAPAALERIKVCRAMLEEKLAAKEIMYGTNTGIGEFSEKILNDEQVKEFQRYLVYNHAAGIGDPAADRARPRGAGGPHQRPRARQLRLPPRDHADAGRDAQQGRHAGRLPERVGRRVRRPGADGAGGAAAAGRRRGVLPGRAAAGRRGDGARGHPRAGPAGARRAGGHQRLEPADRDVGAAHLRHGAVAEAGGDRRGDVDRGAARQPEAVQHEAARAARIQRRDRRRRRTS